MNTTLPDYEEGLSAGNKRERNVTPNASSFNDHKKKNTSLDMSADQSSYFLGKTFDFGNKSSPNGKKENPR